MSSIAIVTIGAASAGAVLLSAAFLALGLGIGIGFLIAFRRGLDKESREKLMTEIRNISYKTRTDVRGLGHEVEEKFSKDIEQIEKITSEMEESLEKNELEQFEHMAVLFHEKIIEVSQKTELERLDLLELPSEIKKYEGLLQKVFSPESLSGMPDAFRKEMDTLIQEFQNAAGTGSQLEKKLRLEEIYRKADMLLRRGKAARSITTLMDEDTAAGLYHISKTREEMISEMCRYLGLIRELDADTFEDVKPLAEGIEKETYSQRTMMAVENVKLRYGKLKETIARTAVYRDALRKVFEETYRYEGSGPLLNDLNRIIEKKYIDREEYRAVSLKTAEFILEAEKKLKEEVLKKETVLKIKSALEGLGYSIAGEERMVSGLENGEIVYLDTKWDDYRIMLRLDEKEELVTRMVRVVPDQKAKENISDYQRGKDRETARQWCRDYDGFLKKLREAGLHMDVKLRKEPEEESVLYIVNEELSGRRRKYPAIEQKPDEKRMS